MNMSSSQPHSETSHYDDYGFDLQQDFSQFLEEAKEHGQEAKQKCSSVYPEESRKTGSEKERKGKKTWKSSLTSWWKADKKIKVKETHNNSSKSKVSEKRQGHVSGPIHNSYKGNDVKHKHHFSGPLANLFKPTKREENEIPYMCLQQQNGHPVQNYGPLYVVT